MRSPGGHRLYTIDDQRRLRFILRGRELGFSIEELRSPLSLVDSQDYTCGEISDLTIEHIQSVRQKIADLKRLERTLAKISKECSGGAVPECPVLDALRSEEHTSELQSLMRISYAVFCLKKQTQIYKQPNKDTQTKN